MEPRAERLLDRLTDINASMDAKIEDLLAIRQDIRQNNVPENALPTLFESIKLGISSQYTRYCGAAFSTLGNLVKRLFSQEQQRHIATYARLLYPVLLERLGDQKERIRTHAFQAFTDFWPASQREVEDAVLGTALTGRNPRAKQMAIEWLLYMVTNHGLTFRCFVPDVVRCLEDADFSVREAAKSTLVELFVTQDDEDKAFLQEILEAGHLRIRKATREWILDRIGPFEDPDPRGPNSQRFHQNGVDSQDKRRVEEEKRLAKYERKIATKERDIARCQGPAENLRQRLDFGGSYEKSHIDRVVSRPPNPPRSKTPVNENALQVQRSAHTIPTWDEADVVPVIVKSAHQVEDIFRALIPDFEGRETEKNWSDREKHIILLRQVVIGNAPRDYSQVFYPALKTHLESVFKAVWSLRTTLSSNGCYFIIDMARWLGPGIDGMVEIIIQNLFKVCVVSKKITAQNGNKAVVAVMAHVSYNHRLLQHVQSAGGDKSVQLRQFAAEWLRTIINRHTTIRAAIEHGNGLSMIVSSIKTGLADPNPNVRDEMRHTYWSFYAAWPTKAQTIASDMDSKSRSLLEKSEFNPKQRDTPTSLPAKEGPAAPAKGRLALKSAIAAQKRVHLKTEAPDTTAAAPPKEPPSTAAPLLHSAPVRPKVRRLEGDRPVVADPRAHLTKPSVLPEASPMSDDFMHSAKSEYKPLKYFDIRSRPRAKDQASVRKVAHRNEKEGRAPPEQTVTRDEIEDQAPLEQTVTRDETEDHARPEQTVTHDEIEDQAPLEQTVTHDETEDHSHPEQTVTRDETEDQAPLEQTVTRDETEDHAHPEQTVTRDETEDHAHPEQTVTRDEIEDQAPHEQTVLYHDKVDNGVQRQTEALSEKQQGKRPVRTSLESMVVFDPCQFSNLSEEPDLPIQSSPPLRRNMKTLQPSAAADVAPTSLTDWWHRPQKEGGTGDWIPPDDPHLLYLLPDTPPTHTPSGFGNGDDSLSLNYVKKEPLDNDSPTKRPNSHEERVPPVDIGVPPHPPGYHRRLQQEETPTAEISIEEASMHSAQQGVLQHGQLQQNDASSEDVSRHEAQQEHFLQQEEVPEKKVKEAASEELEVRPTHPRVRHVSFRAPSPNDDPRFRGALLERSEETSNRRALVSSPSGSQDPNRSQHLLDRGIQLIRSNRMDPHGFRRLRRLLESSEGTAMSQDHLNDLVIALLGALKRGSPPGGKGAGETAMLPLLDVLEHTIVGREGGQSRYTPELYHQTITAFLETKKRCDASTYFAVRLDGVARSLVKAELNEGTYNSVDAILDIITKKEEESNNVIVMGLLLVVDILRFQIAINFGLPESILRRVGTLAADRLTDGQAEVRRLVCQLCVQLKGIVGEEKFWEFLGTPSMGTRNLLTYYLARG